MKPAGGRERTRRPPRPGETRTRSPGATEPGRLEPLGWIALGVWAFALFASSPDSTTLWGFNGFRTAAHAWPVLLLAAGAAWAMARWKPRAIGPWLAVAAVLAFALAFPWREKVHVLGDTQLRMRALFAERLPSAGASWSEWLAHTANTLHAAPLDLLLNVIPAVALHGLGMRISTAVAWVGAVQALLFMALAWRLARHLAPGSSLLGPLALAIVLTGVLEAFAGYADSASLVALVALGWWSEILVPLDRRAQAWRVTAWFVALVLTHRVGAVMLLPQVLRAAGPALPGDQPEARRALLAVTAAVAAVAIAGALMTAAGRQLMRDATEILRSAAGFTWKPLDIASALIVVAPLALIAPALAGRAGSAFWRDPRALWIASGAAPLLVALIWLFPFGESGLGMHRDWDTNVLLGITLMVGAAVLLCHAGLPRLGVALQAALPLLALTALSWVAVNADAGLATRRAIALATEATALTAPQRAHLHLYFGQRAMDERQPEVGAMHYEKAFREGGNPRRALLAAEAWLVAGRADRARAAIAEARAAGALSPELEAGARRLESSLAPADTASVP